MINGALKFARGIVRPAIALGLTGAQIVLGFLWVRDGQAVEGFAPFAGLLPLTLIVVRDYFASRPDRSDDAADHQSAGD